MKQQIYDRVAGMLNHSGAQPADVNRFTHVMNDEQSFTRRLFLQTLGIGTAGLLLPTGLAYAQTSNQVLTPLPDFTGPTPNPFWNSVSTLVSYPQKVPLLRLTDRPVQLETPRHYFATAFTPNDAFFVRWHLDEIPTAVNLEKWRLQIEGNIDKPLSLSLADLIKNYTAVSVAAVCQCAGNSRSFFQPRIPGGQWGHGAMGNATWTGVRLRDLLNTAGLKTGSLQVQFEGLERGKNPSESSGRRYLKSLDVTDPVIDESLIAYLMNGEPLPMLNGFPVRLVVPGKFSTYWTKALSVIRILTEADKSFWMDSGYKIPDTPRGHTTPQDVKDKKVKMVPIGAINMPVRSFIITPDGASKMPAGLPITVRGIAFSGYGGVAQVEFSNDEGKTWQPTKLGEDYGVHSFRLWEHVWTPTKPGRYILAVRAKDGKGNLQLDEGVWNPSGYLWNKIERQEIVVGSAG
jgi:DMSO/TMAO reductase YedYZ molybdopterin-dependent catalytic subunit